MEKSPYDRSGEDDWLMPCGHAGYNQILPAGCYECLSLQSKASLARENAKENAVAPSVGNTP